MAANGRFVSYQLWSLKTAVLPEQGPKTMPEPPTNALWLQHLEYGASWAVF